MHFVSPISNSSRDENNRYGSLTIKKIFNDHKDPSPANHFCAMDCVRKIGRPTFWSYFGR